MSHGNPISRFIYCYAPFQLKTWMANGYGWIEQRRKYGKHFYQQLRFLEQSQWFTKEEIKQFQIDELKKLLSHAVQTVPYYRNLFQKLNLSLEDINSIQDLYKIPILTKEEVRHYFSQFISEYYSKRKLLTTHTGGSTGTPLTIMVSNEAYQKKQAFIWQQRSWAGNRYRDRTATFAGHMITDIRRQKPPFWVENNIENQILFSSYHMTQMNLKYYSKKLISFQPELIWGYPSSLFIMATYLKNRTITEIRPKAIFVSSETLFDFQREMIENVFGAKVYNLYANAELSANIAECEFGNLHIRHEHGIVEFIDSSGQPVKYGEEGEMVCTGFINHAMVLVRYNIGDVAVPIEKQCPCGRSGNLVRELSGRIDDFIITPDGRYIGRLLSIVSKEMKRVKEMQIIQDTVDTVIFNIVKDITYHKQDEKRLIMIVQKRLGSNIKIQIDYVDQIPRMKNGKIRYVQSFIEKKVNF